MLISLEGVDGSGKTTQIYRIVNLIQKKGLEAYISEEFSNSKIGEVINDLLLYDPFIRFQQTYSTSYAELMLLLSDFAYRTETAIIPSLNKGTIVVADRHIDSPLAYQLQLLLRNEAYDQLSFDEWQRFILKSFPKIPDLTFYIEISVETSIHRVMSRKRKTDQITDDFERIIGDAKNVYERLAKQFPERIVKINGEQSPEQVTQDIVEKLELFLLSNGND